MDTQNNMNIFDRVDEYFFKADKGEVYSTAIKVTEKALIEKALEKTRGNQIEAAGILGIHRNTMRAKIKELNIDVERFKQ